MPDLKTIIFIVCAAFSVFFFNEARYADSTTMEQVAMRLDQKIVADQLKAVQGRIWALEDRYRDQTMPTTVFEEYRLLLEDKKRLIKQLGNIKL